MAAALRGVASLNPNHRVIEDDKILFNGSHDKKKVAVVSGGGSGHEPSHAGYVGKGMLAAAVCGDVFASPSTKQITTACNEVPSDEGYVFVVTNYTGDMLHFGLAANLINASDSKARAGIIKSADDVSVGREHGGLVGRRGLSGTMILNKILGGAAEAGVNFDGVMKLGTALAENIVTINAGLDHCHVPGRGKDYGQLGEKQCEIGLGIHNEPGVKMLEEIPPASELVEKMLTLMLDPNDKDRAFVSFDAKKDKVAMLINNLGGVSILEQFGLTDVARQQLENKYGIVPSRVYSGHFMTSLNAPIFAITLVNISGTARDAGISEDEVIKHLDAPTDACAWPQNHYGTATDKIDIKKQLHTVSHKEDKGPRLADLKVDPATLEKVLRAAANNVIEREPDLTEWDTKMGDGDCGKTLEAGSRALLELLDKGLAKPGSVLDVLEEILDITELKMGGTLGAIFGIFFSAFVAAIKAKVGDNKDAPSVVLSQAAADALANLRKHTPASEGDRTVMDVLIPTVKTLADTKDITKAAESAHKAAEGTKHIKPKLGRATYVGGLDELSVLPPDPGAWGAYEIFRGLALD